MNIDFLKTPSEPPVPGLTPIREKILLLILFFCVSLSLMAPIASDTYLPQILDYKNHTALVVQAKMAIDEGQFPIRVTPFEHQSLSYPIFQFYSPLMYTIAGSIYKWFTPNNPYVALKYTVILAFMLAGIYSYRSALLLTKNKKIAVVAALVYMCTPYLLINLLARGAFTEFFAQGLIPMVLYYNLMATQQNAPRRTLIELALAWALLALSHSITFIYTSFFMGLLFLGLALHRILTVKTLFKLALAYGFACLLSLWMLAPAWDMASIAEIGTRNPYLFNWLTPLSSLLSFTAVSPMPLPGNYMLLTKIYVSLGLPMLIALGFALMRLFAVESFTPSRRFFTTVLFVYFFAFLLAWAPFNVYEYLPTLLDVAQFSYRLLTQTTWIGIIIVSVFLSTVHLMEKPNTSFYVVFIAITFLAASPWVQTQQDSGAIISDIVANPDSGYGKTGYCPQSSLIFRGMDQSGVREKTLSFTDKKHALHAKADTLPFLGAPCFRSQGSTVCNLTAKSGDKLTPIPAMYYPKGLNITVDGETVSYEPALSAKYVIAAVKMPKGPHKVVITYTGYPWANKISLFALILGIVGLMVTSILDIRATLQIRK